MLDYVIFIIDRMGLIVDIGVLSVSLQFWAEPVSKEELQPNSTVPANIVIIIRRKVLANFFDISIENMLLLLLYCNNYCIILCKLIIIETCGAGV